MVELLLQAVCCSDHIHCCSEGQTCDVQKGSCNSGDKTTEWFHKIPALPTTSQGEADVKCPDGTACPSGSTCCKLEGSGYGCCPLPQVRRERWPPLTPLTLLPPANSFKITLWIQNTWVNRVNVGYSCSDSCAVTFHFLYNM